MAFNSHAKHSMLTNGSIYIIYMVPLTSCIKNYHIISREWGVRSVISKCLLLWHVECAMGQMKTMGFLDSSFFTGLVSRTLEDFYCKEQRNLLWNYLLNLVNNSSTCLTCWPHDYSPAQTSGCQVCLRYTVSLKQKTRRVHAGKRRSPPGVAPLLRPQWQTRPFIAH